MLKMTIPNLKGRVDQSAKRWIHQTIGYETHALICMVDPLRLIHPTTACQVHGPWAVLAVPIQAARNDSDPPCRAAGQCSRGSN